MFEPFEGVPDYPKLEQEILTFWDEFQIFNLLRKQTENGERWDFQDGPITANNPMGVHHAWGRTYKDIFDRFHAMRGKNLRWQNGFDCQGLWVEVEVEKALGFKGKPDIEAFGLEKFSRACRERVEKYADVIAEQSKRLGMWMDWPRSYFTFDDSNIEHIWLFLKKCHEEGWLAQDYRVMPWCPRCETSLSQHESADSYKDITHRSVYIALPVLSSNVSIAEELGAGAELLATAVGLGVNRAVDAAKEAVGSASIGPTSLGSRQLLITIEADDSLTIGDTGEIVNVVRAATKLEESEIFWTLSFDSNLNNEVCVSLFASNDAQSDVERLARRIEHGKFAGDRFLVWTTTPWTLTANVALALHPDLTYVRAKTGDNVVILSKGTVASALRPGYEILEEFPGSELVGLSYSGPLDDIPFQQELTDTVGRRVVAWDTVGETEGTGIVHIAPGCGAEDFELGKREHLGHIVPTSPSAHFLPGAGPLAGLHALDDAESVFENLRERDRLYRIQRYEHSYPHCWRCGTELIFYSVKEWFIRADAGPRPARGRLRSAAQQVEWIPEYAGKRMDDWLFNMGDWCISRKRFWGLPLPIYMDEDGKWDVIASRAELRERAVEPEKFDALPELHRPWIDSVTIWNRERTKVMTRVPEVGDAWLDAGIVPFATVGYNGTDDIRMPELKIASKDEWQPVDFISEMREQVRLWFFSMLFMGVALEDRAPYKRAMVYETMLNQDGEKISKTLKNGVPYEEAVTTVGADPMRWTFCGNTITKDIRFGYRQIHESQRRLITLWNVYSFFVTYANLDKPNLAGVGQSSVGGNPLDAWILARLQKLVVEVTAALESVQPSEVTRSVESFVDILSNWYVRRSRRRFWKSGSDEDKQAAYRTLHHVLLTLCRLIAPVIPFTAEAMYQNLKRPLADAAVSVHLLPWPTIDEKLRNDSLLGEVESVLNAVSLGHKARKESKVKVRQPLPRVLIQAPPASREALQTWRETILDELNVKALELLDDAGDLVTYKLRANLPKLGPRYGKQIGAIRGALENAAPDEAKRIGGAARRGESVMLQLGETEIELAPDDVLVQTQQQSGYSFASEGDWAVAIDTTLDENLRDEGYARDFVRAVQEARKKAGFEVSDHIAILLVEPEEPSRFPRMLENFGDYVQDETLAEELRLVDEDYPELGEVEVGDETIRLRVEKLQKESL